MYNIYESTIFNKTETEILTNSNKCTINKVMAIARKSPQKWTELLKYFKYKYNSCKPYTIGRELYFEYLETLVIGDGC